MAICQLLESRKDSERFQRKKAPRRVDGPQLAMVK
jgi:hypothetical protein